MSVSIELFLLDNLMMNYLMLRIACVLAGGRARHGRMLTVSAFGAVYALLSMTVAPWLRGLVPKLLLGCVMALPLIERKRAAGKAIACLYLSACLTGGIMFGLLMLFGGEFKSGAYIGTVPVRLALLAACVCAVLPRCIVSVLQAVRQRSLRVAVMLRFDDRTITLHALADSGNLLTEPISGLPVMVVRPGLLPADKKGRPVAYHSVGGSGILHAVRPDEAVVYLRRPVYVSLMAAESGQTLMAADAIIPASLLTEEGRCGYAHMEEDSGTVVQAAAPAPGGSDPVYPFGGDAAGAAPAAGGADVD